MKTVVENGLKNTFEKIVGYFCFIFSLLDLQNNFCGNTGASFGLIVVNICAIYTSGYLVAINQNCEHKKGKNEYA